MKGGAEKPKEPYIQPDAALLEPHVPGIEVREVSIALWDKEVALANLVTAQRALIQLNKTRSKNEQSKRG